MTEENYNYRTSQKLLRNQFPGKGKLKIPIIPKFQESPGDFDDLYFKDPDRTVLGFYKEVGHDFSCGESFAKRVDDFIIHSIFAACFVFLEQFAELWTSIGTANDPTDLTFSVAQERFLTDISTMAEAPVLAWSLR
mgnify:CR=1 FL=1